MARELRTFQPLKGPASALVAAFTSDPSEWLPTSGTDSADASPDDITSEDVADVDRNLALCVTAGSFARRVRATIGQPRHMTRTSWRSISWERISLNDDRTGVDRMLPPLDGELGIHVDASGRATLVLDARYVPPGGIVGAAVDAVALHRLARQTGQRFLADVGAGLNRVASQWAAPQHPGPALGE
jgi:photosystem II stability/assembly factor-like uncharacterized protein